MSRFGMDIDGVLANFDRGFLDVLNRVYGKEYTEEDLENKRDWDYFKTLEDLTLEQENDAFKYLGEWFWLRLEPYDQKAMLAISLLSEKHNIYFITDRHPNPTKELTLWQTRKWLEHFNISPAGVILTKEKPQACKLLGLEYFIDDNVKNVNNINKTDTKCFVMNKSYNSKCKAERIYSIWDYISIIRGV